TRSQPGSRRASAANRGITSYPGADQMGLANALSRGGGPTVLERVCPAILLAAILAACSAPPPPAVLTPERAPAALTPPQTSEKWLGNVWSTPQLPGFLDHWDQVTPENAGKWSRMEPR